MKLLLIFILAYSNILKAEPYTGGYELSESDLEYSQELSAEIFPCKPPGGFGAFSDFLKSGKNLTKEVHRTFKDLNQLGSAVKENQNNYIDSAQREFEKLFNELNGMFPDQRIPRPPNLSMSYFLNPIGEKYSESLSDYLDDSRSPYKDDPEWKDYVTKTKDRVKKIESDFMNFTKNSVRAQFSMRNFSTNMEGLEVQKLYGEGEKYQSQSAEISFDKDFLLGPVNQASTDHGIPPESVVSIMFMESYDWSMAEKFIERLTVAKDLEGSTGAGQITPFTAQRHGVIPWRPGRLGRVLASRKLAMKNKTPDNIAKILRNKANFFADTDSLKKLKAIKDSTWKDLTYEELKEQDPDLTQKMLEHYNMQELGELNDREKRFFQRFLRMDMENAKRLSEFLDIESLASLAKPFQEWEVKSKRKFGKQETLSQRNVLRLLSGTWNYEEVPNNLLWLKQDGVYSEGAKFFAPFLGPDGKFEAQTNCFEDTICP